MTYKQSKHAGLGPRWAIKHAELAPPLPPLLCHGDGKKSTNAKAGVRLQGHNRSSGKTETAQSTTQGICTPRERHAVCMEEKLNSKAKFETQTQAAPSVWSSGHQQGQENVVHNCGFAVPCTESFSEHHLD